MATARSALLLLLLMCVLPCLSHAVYDAEQAWHAQYYNIAAYCDADKIRSWNCGPACEVNKHFTPMFVLDNELFMIKVVVGLDTTSKQIVVSFSGSKKLLEFFEGLDFLAMPYLKHDCPGGCVVHGVLHDTSNSFQDTVVEKVVGLLQDYKDFSVLVTGHSIGAALATLTAVALSVAISKLSSIDYKDVPLDLYTFGSPRIGNEAMVKWAASVLPPGRHFRIVHNSDILPHFPPQQMKFMHLPTEVWYEEYSNTSYIICDDSASAESKACSNSLKLPISFEDHVSYFGVDALCTAKPVSSRSEVRLLMAQKDALKQGRQLTLSSL